MHNFYVPDSSKTGRTLLEILCKDNKNVLIYPENGISPWEQIEYITSIINNKEEIHIVTFSPYIMNYLNILIKRNLLSPENIQANYVYIENNELKYRSLIGKNEKNETVVDTYDLSEPMAAMAAMYEELY